MVKNLPASAGDESSIPRRPLEKEMAAHSSVLAWKTPWTEEPGGLQSMGSQKKPQDLAIKQQQKGSNLPEKALELCPYGWR